MPKLRITALDVRAMVSSIRSQVEHLRVANVYDISSKIYVLKMMAESQRRFLLIEAGVRFHLSDWKRDKQSVPSPFTMTLRKYIRTKRLTSIRQLGGDRVVDIQFGQGETSVHLIVEFYSRGNVVLADYQYNVVASWRQYKSETGELTVQVKGRYPLEAYEKPSNFLRIPVSVIRDGDVVKFQQLLKEEVDAVVVATAADDELESTTKKKNQIKLADVIGKINPASHQSLINQVLDRYNLRSKLIHSFEDIPVTETKEILKDLLDVWDSVDAASKAPPGYLYKLNKEDVYDQFSPIPLTYDARTSEEIVMEKFHTAVDTYFTKLDLAKFNKADTEKLHDLESKVDRIRRDQQARVEKLLQERNCAEKCAFRVEHHVDFVGKILEMVSKLVSTGADWNTIDQAIKQQRREGHPLASYILKTNLKESIVTVILPDPAVGFDPVDVCGEDTEELLSVDLNVNENVFANIKRLHQIKKACHTKYQRTEAAAKAVVARAENAARSELIRRDKAISQRPAIQRNRKVFWFEKFYWFISSDKYLVLAGHDAMQNEILYRKYLTKHDIYVHADVHGAATCIIRNPTGEPVPDQTINEAGTMAVCRSSAWKSKILTSAYWVHAYQVSKTPQAGEYVTTGGFIIRGKRNPILVHKLEMGIGLLFSLAPDNCNDQDDDPLPTSGNASPDMMTMIMSSASSSGGHQVVGDDSMPSSALPLDGSRRESLRSSGSHVQFGSFEILPTPLIEPRVEFQDLPPEVILVRSDKSIISEDDEEDDEEEIEVGVTPIGTINRRRSSDLRRPDSADELPPPEAYQGRSAPKDLLARRTPETAPGFLEEDSEDEDGDAAEAEAEEDSGEVIANLGLMSLRDPLDGGPPPRGFLSDEVLSAKELLKLAGKRRSSNSLLLMKEEPVAEQQEKERRSSPLKLLSKYQKAKMKKMKKKYGEQSDDERELAMKLIGSNRMKYEQQESDLADESDQRTTKPSEWSTKSNSTAPQFPDRKLEEEDSDKDEEEWKSRLQDLKSLTGHLNPGDSVTFAIPVCAPYSALSTYQYKGKLLPGGCKKGQAVQIIHRYFIENAQAHSTLRQIIRSIPADEFSAVLVASPQVVVEGGSKIAKDLKKNEKKLKKALRGS